MSARKRKLARTVPDSQSDGKPPKRRSARLRERNNAGSQQKSRGEEAPSDKNTQQIDTAPATNPQLPAEVVDNPNHGRAVAHWCRVGNWPLNFADKLPGTMSAPRSEVSIISINRQQGRSSYDRFVKKKQAPEQYTASYEVWILTKGLDMSRLKGKELICDLDRAVCLELRKINYEVFQPFYLSPEELCAAVEQCQNRNESAIKQMITPIIMPPLPFLSAGGGDKLQHVIIEYDADWDKRYTLAGPTLRPDFAVGLQSSIFSPTEIYKLDRYSATDNWTQFTKHLYFPFLMCESKCGNAGLDTADRQNMHSCSVAVRALLRIEEEADKYRCDKKASDLNGSILVFSISHNQAEARLYGHYAMVEGEQRSYYRYYIGLLDLTDEGLLGTYNFVRNVLDSHLPKHVQRLKDALACLPDPIAPVDSLMTSPYGYESGFGLPGPSDSSVLLQELENLRKQSELQQVRSEALLKQMEKRMEVEGKRMDDKAKRMDDEAKRMENVVKRMEDEAKRVDKRWKTKLSIARHKARKRGKSTRRGRTGCKNKSMI